MKTLSAVYKGNRTIELSEDLALCENTRVLVLIPNSNDEDQLRDQLRTCSETAFAQLWKDEKDDVWSDYL